MNSSFNRSGRHGRLQIEPLEPRRLLAATVPKTNPTAIYMHYMPWFETPESLGGQNWGYHWTMSNQDPNVLDSDGHRQIASHFYPHIGPYASSDPDVIEYHLLLMKLAGVDGVILDWYGEQGSNGDIDHLLANSNAVIDRIDDAGLQFGVVLEDRFATSVEDVKANIGYLRDNYFANPAYIRQGSEADPLVMVFGPIRMQQPSQWTEILQQAGEPVDLLTLWYESGDVGANGSGEFAWIYEDEALDNYLDHVSNFYQLRSANLEVAGGIAFPGFEDFYVEGGVGNIVPFTIPHDNGQTLAATLNLADQHSSAIDFLQLATWNDFGEGTIFEPTLETGFDYLLQLQQFTGTPYGVTELQLVRDLYSARKLVSFDSSVSAQLDQAAVSIAELNFPEAESILSSVVPAPDLVDSSDTGFSQSDDLTSDSTPTFSGTTGAGLIVELIEGTTVLASTVSDAEGNWTVTTPVLDDGVHSMRIRLRDEINVSPMSAALSVLIFDAANLDFGDAPNPFPTTISVDGARHIATGPQLGPTRDVEPNGQPEVAADGDGDDEDGVMFGTIQVGRTMAGVNIELGNASAALVDAWLDFDGDGVWQDDEQILENRLVTDSAPIQTLNFTINADALIGSTFARVRLSSAGNLTPTGLALDGEVEDYRVSITAPPTVESVIIGDGDPQRSSLTKLVVTFDQIVDVSPNAFVVRNRQTGESVSGLVVDSVAIGGKTVAEISFPPQPLVVSRANGEHSLRDGSYQLEILKDRVNAIGDQAGMAEDYHFGDSETDMFFRLFGDSDGDHDVDSQDLGRFGLSFLSLGTDAHYRPFLDHDGDGDIDGQDWGRFQTRFQ